MFSLDQAITKWRRQMLDDGIKTPVTLDELESHLRDDIEDQVRSGINAEQAFNTAVLRIGESGALKSEFAKIDGLNEVLRRKEVWALIGVAFLSCWIEFGNSPGLVLAYGVLLAGLIVATFIDFKHFIIPDQITIGGTLAGLLCSFLLPSLHGQKLLIHGVFQSLVGIGVGAGAVYFVLRVGNLLFAPKRMETVGAETVLPCEVMGFGNVKLMAAIGAFLGWQAVVFSLLVSAMIGSVVGVALIAVHRREWSSRLPYGPCIALATAIWIFGGKHLFEAFVAP